MILQKPAYCSRANKYTRTVILAMEHESTRLASKTTLFFFHYALTMVFYSIFHTILFR